MLLKESKMLSFDTISEEKEDSLLNSSIIII